MSEVVEITLTDAADALDNAAKYIDEHGWCQGSLREAEGKVCALGSIMFSRFDSMEWKYTQYWKMQGILEKFLKLPESDSIKPPLAIWNDAQGRTQEEVVTALRECAESLRD